MATSRREPDARISRTKPSEPAQGLRRARSVPSSPDRRVSPSPAASSSSSSSSNACRPSSSFNSRTASSRTATLGSIHSKTPQSPSSSSSSMAAAAKPASTARGRADRSGGSSLWPPALATKSHGRRSSNDTMNRAAKSSSTLHRSSLSPRPAAAEKMASVPSPKQRAHKAVPGKSHGVVSSVQAPGTAAKKKTGVANPAPSIQRIQSVPASSMEVPRIDEQEVDLLVEFDEMESISTPSIEEHLQERLPDPVDATTYAVSQDASEASCDQPGGKSKEAIEFISEGKHEDPDKNSLNGGDNADVGISSELQVVKEAIDESELEEVASEIELKEAVNEAELNEVVSGSGLSKDVDAPKFTEDAVEPMLIGKEGSEENVEMVVPPKKTPKLVQSWRNDDERSNEVKEDGRSKPTEERKSKVMALIGRFETAMSG